MLGTLARVVAVYSLGVGLAGAAVVYGLGVLLMGLPPGVAALMVAMVGVAAALAGYAGQSDATTVTAGEDAGGGDPETIAWSDAAGRLQTLAFVGAGVALYGFLGMALSLVG